jgi:elongation factor P
MITATQLRKGTTFELDGELWKVLSYQHYKPGRGNAVIRTTLRNIRKGGTIEKNFSSGERFQDVRLDHNTVQYLYREGDLYYFMDVQTFEQTPLSADLLGDAVNYLQEGLQLELSSYEGESIDIDLPTTVDLKVTEAEPGFAGDTATGATKIVAVETGMKVQVPLFVDVGTVIRVDTRDGTYVTRV